ncbi:MAG: hypothetical protein LUI08_02020 [Prevotella sp.]|nr:hypothetical protein [Prevotella sp.]
MLTNHYARAGIRATFAAVLRVVRKKQVCRSSKQKQVLRISKKGKFAGFQRKTGSWNFKKQADQGLKRSKRLVLRKVKDESKAFS